MNYLLVLASNEDELLFDSDHVAEVLKVTPYPRSDMGQSTRAELAKRIKLGMSETSLPSREAAPKPSRDGKHNETEFLLGDRELGGPRLEPRVRGRAHLEFVTLSPFPHCVLPEHFFERFIHANK